MPLCLPPAFAMPPSSFLAFLRQRALVSLPLIFAALFIDKLDIISLLIACFIAVATPCFFDAYSAMPLRYRRHARHAIDVVVILCHAIRHAPCHFYAYHMLPDIMASATRRLFYCRHNIRMVILIRCWREQRYTPPLYAIYAIYASATIIDICFFFYALRYCYAAMRALMLYLLRYARRAFRADICWPAMLILF